jgi:hypothetical protein
MPPPSVGRKLADVGKPTIRSGARQVSKTAVPKQFVPKHLWRHCQMENTIPAISSALAMIVAMPTVSRMESCQSCFGSNAMLHHPTEGAGLHAYLRLPSSLASHPGRASADSSARLAGGGSCHAHTINPRPASAAGGSDLRDHAVRLRKRCGGQGLGRRCNR